MITIHIDKWRDLPVDFETIKRILSARGIKDTKVNLVGPCRAEIEGSEGTYDVTLESCTCVDFAIRGLPCKHILKLALDAGLIDGLPDDGKAAAAEFRKIQEAEAQKYLDLWYAGKMPGDKLRAVVNALLK